MRLFEAIIEANQRAVAGDPSAGLHVADYADELPVVALTCIDPRLNRLFPGALGLPADSFIWLRNAGNIITGSMDFSMRSLALACAVKGGKEIVIIGHTDCQVAKTSVSDLTERFKAMGIDRQQLPDNLAEYFGVFASERQNVIKAVDFVRHSPLISPKVPVQGFVIDTGTGKLEWIVNGYQALDRPLVPPPPAIKLPEIGATGSLGDKIGAGLSELKVSAQKIGELATEAKQIASEIKTAAAPATAPVAAPKPPPIPAKPPPGKPIPMPPPIRMGPKR